MKSTLKRNQGSSSLNSEKNSIRQSSAEKTKKCLIESLPRKALLEIGKKERKNFANIQNLQVSQWLYLVKTSRKKKLNHGGAVVTKKEDPKAVNQTPPCLNNFLMIDQISLNKLVNMSNTEMKGYSTYRPSSYRAMSAKTLNSKDSRMYTLELEARNKYLRTKMKNPQLQMQEQIKQLKLIIAEEE